jgi:hypothetical protein
MAGGLPLRPLLTLTRLREHDLRVVNFVVGAQAEQRAQRNAHKRAGQTRHKPEPAYTLIGV